MDPWYDFTDPAHEKNWHLNNFHSANATVVSDNFADLTSKTCTPQVRLWIEAAYYRDDSMYVLFYIRSTGHSVLVFFIILGMPSFQSDVAAIH